MFKYEMHCHTKETSKCATIYAAQMIDFYKSVGYTGVVITDHFFNGNTTVPSDIPWSQRVELFVQGFENAKQRGDEIGIDVFFGWEFSLNGTDFLTYGLNKDWLLDHEDCHKLKINDYCDLVHERGGYIVQAHPFREASYIDMIRLLPRKVDAIEVLNASRGDFENKLADEYADNYSLPKIYATDNHTGHRERIAAVKVNEKVTSVNDIMKLVLENKHKNIVLEL
jgi:predicted metal-dependent phosphoesterase TrpH